MKDNQMPAKILSFLFNAGRDRKYNEKDSLLCSKHEVTLSIAYQNKTDSFPFIITVDGIEYEITATKIGELRK